jgi:hypothetical protein
MPKGSGHDKISRCHTAEGTNCANQSQLAKNTTVRSVLKNQSEPDRTQLDARRFMELRMAVVEDFLMTSF